MTAFAKPIVVDVQREQRYQEKKSVLIADLQQQIQQSEGAISLKKETSNLFRHRQQKKHKIDVRAFDQVIAVDRDNLIAEVEGMTTYEALVNETLRHHCLPTVVPELKTITIGGALSGIGIESSSFRYGLVHETITEVEVLLGDGRVVTCNAANEYSDLFFALPNSYGTLGYVLKLKVKLIPIKAFVKLSYQHFVSPKDYFYFLETGCDANYPSGPVA